MSSVGMLSIVKKFLFLYMVSELYDWVLVCIHAAPYYYCSFYIGGCYCMVISADIGISHRDCTVFVLLQQLVPLLLRLLKIPEHLLERM